MNLTNNIGMTTKEFLLLENLVYLSKRMSDSQEGSKIKYHYCIKKKEALAADLGVSLASIYNYLNDLEDMGFISRKGRKIYVDRDYIASCYGKIEGEEAKRYFPVYLDHMVKMLNTKKEELRPMRQKWLEKNKSGLPDLKKPMLKRSNVEPKAEDSFYKFLEDIKRETGENIGEPVETDDENYEEDDYNDYGE